MKKYLFILMLGAISSIVFPSYVLATIGATHTVIGKPIYQVSSALSQAEAYFDFPEGITADSAGNLYLADTQNNVIRRIDAVSGVVTTVVGNGRYGDGTRLAHPRGITVGADGALYIADTDNGKIKKYVHDTLTTIISNLTAPVDISVAVDTLYYIDTASNSLLASNLDGTNQHIITTALKTPTYLQARSTGDYVYVANAATYEIVRVNVVTGEIEFIAEIYHDESYFSTFRDLVIVEGIAITQDDLFVAIDNGSQGSIMLIDPDISFTYSYTTSRGTTITNNEVVRGYIILDGSNSDDSLRNSYFGATAPWEMEFNSPRGLVVVGNTLYITNTGGGQIYTGYIPNLTDHNYLNPVWATFAGKDRFQSISGQFGYPGRPKDIVFTKDGNKMYFSENNQIKSLALTPDYTVHSIAGNTIDNYSSHDLPAMSGTDARFSDPSAITLSLDETKLYVVDRNNNRIRYLDLATNTVYKLTGDGARNSVGDSENGYREGEPCITEDGMDYENYDYSVCALFSRPYGIAMDPTGQYVYVSDAGNQVIRKIEISGNDIGRTHLLAGTPNQAGFIDGATNVAQFNLPQGLTIDRAGKNLYVADRDNHAIRHVRISDGYVSTVVGSPATRSELDGGFATAGLNLPVEVLWKKHRLYFTDASKRLRRINFNRQQVISLSGNGRPGYMNGNSRLTQFEGILGIAVKGKFAYVSDYQNDAIRQVRVR